ncbi:Putative P-loop containing nucleoside triphosphate hydrolase [Septoria linicola]|uniref:P-loop containing nucleoside triphosphate hydrolase n=1 Tax=Septoria linicola TaxID=215465 RepID=A0A9Q9B954_9PEZI|nr:Putative P-loop containing nucleoside triphosphate hydrolase [Septoria linicola]
MAHASIFTWEEDTPRVASPWLTAADGGSSPIPEVHAESSEQLSDAAQGLREGVATDNKVTRLQAEPQDGPVEYKLHLLLRPRRKFRSTSTGAYVPGSKHARLGDNPPKIKVSADLVVDSNSSPGNVTPSQSTQQIRQHRLQQLTTQLLWRLQQSAPHHTSSATNTILPTLPEALPELQAPQQVGRLLHGLEESQGALYEIGVSDDGTLIGLAEDELQESLNNLRAMAACLGCTVEVLRQETVGECEWLEDTVIAGEERKVRRSGKLVVAEALVRPFLRSSSPTLSGQVGKQIDTSLTAWPSSADLAPPTTEQLRITLTGPTMSGKSSLLGTMTTSTLDDGRGKSRLSMLRHGHERSSGVTSSVTQELIGYQDGAAGSVQVVNYATANIASWIDMHVASASSRLILISDSAGHPRYRRTTLRGLVGWAPHWTLLCVPADDSAGTTAAGGSAQVAHQAAIPTALDLASAQLDLCIRLQLPLAIIFTKLDGASKAGLRASLTRILDVLKAAGRKPAIMPNKGAIMDEKDLQVVAHGLLDTAYHTALPLLNDARGSVPIIFTSAVDGTGIGNLHALLHELPGPNTAQVTDGTSPIVFDVEDMYSKPAEVTGVIVSGRLRSGQIAVGDNIYVGPFSGHDLHEESEDSDERPLRRSLSTLPTSRSFPGALGSSRFAPPLYQLPGQEWRRAKVTSIRNLRLPVHSLHADQVGTIAISLDESAGKLSPLLRTRKGMVLSAVQPLATRTFTARFAREDLEHLAVGNHVVVYVSSVRASAKVVSARAPDSPEERSGNALHHDEVGAHDPFGFDEFEDSMRQQSQMRVAGTITAPELLVTLSFDTAKEYVMAGDQVLVMPSGGAPLYAGSQRGEKGVAGLEGFVGRITNTRG